VRVTAPEHYATYFDSNYLMRGLALHDSLQRVSRGSVIWALCLDEPAARALEALALPTFRPVRVATLEAADPELAATRPTRSRIEYYFTCTPAWLAYLMNREPGNARLTYLDADLWFTADPSPLFDELGGGSVAIIPHRFSTRLSRLEAFGRYNVGWITFVNDANGRACLADWRSQCIEWCYDRPEGDRFADQKYLDAWSGRFAGIHEIEHGGANVAPWNLEREPVAVREGRLCAGRWPLLFYHFHGFKRLRPWLFDPGLSAYGVRMDPVLRDRLYVPYIEELRALERRLAERAPEITAAWGTVRPTGWGLLSIAKKLLTGRLFVMREQAQRPKTFAAR
jgi:hypothetical protein